MKVAVAEQFTRTPAGRYLKDGPFSGEAFRTKFLVPALRSGREVIVALDGVEGYGSSFLEEAFGGLVRVEGFRGVELRRILKIQSSDPALELEIWDYIDKAAQEMRQ